nr:4-hydroxythreonine-4-phosphate dehydrogenase PdxA [uncultured Sphaerochaeta sp.]
MKRPVIAILIGDGAGVGPEIVAKLAIQKFYESYCKPVIVGDVRLLERAFQVIKASRELQVVSDINHIDWEGNLVVLDQKNQDPDRIPFGKLTVEAGKANLDGLRLCVALYKKKEIDGFCYAPFNKAGLKEAGIKAESEQHFLANLFNHTEPFGEINVLGNLWTSRTTSHIPISEVSNHLSVESILRAVRLVNKSIRNSGVAKPRLAVAALNPHAGEHGMCGREEIDVIEPAIEKAQAMGIDASGPYPSDITFIKALRGDFDGVVTMYHDQGQIALKLTGFDEGITIAGGFPAPIVTCAHGTAYDIAGTGIVKTRAFENAVKMASRMANHLTAE